MAQHVPPPRPPRNPETHLALAAGDLSAFEELFAAAPDETIDPEDDGPHEQWCPCHHCDDSPVLECDEDAIFDMARDLRADRRAS